jgi:hypothetical protein
MDMGTVTTTADMAMSKVNTALQTNSTAENITMSMSMGEGECKTSVCFLFPTF